MTTRDRYLHHITLTTGHSRRSWRHEVADELVPQFRALIESAREESGARLPIVFPRCWLFIEDTSRCALASVRTEEGVPLLTMAIASHARCGARLWVLLHETASAPVMTNVARRPPEPWLAVRHEPALSLYDPKHPQVLAMSELERCIAWAWLE